MLKSLIGRYHNILLFGAAGFLGYVVDLITTLSFEPLMGHYISRIPAFVFASTTTWLFNRSITFRHRKSGKNLRTEWLHYQGLMIGGLSVNYLVYAVMVTLLPEGVSTITIAVAAGSLAGMFINFVTSSKFIYKRG